MAKKIKRAKTGKVTQKEFTKTLYALRCPHCRTHLTGDRSLNVIEMRCFHCENWIILDWGEVEK